MLGRRSICIANIVNDYITIKRSNIKYEANWMLHIFFKIMSYLQPMSAVQ